MRLMLSVLGSKSTDFSYFFVVKFLSKIFVLNSFFLLLFSVLLNINIQKLMPILRLITITFITAYALFSSCSDLFYYRSVSLFSSSISFMCSYNSWVEGRSRSTSITLDTLLLSPLTLTSLCQTLGLLGASWRS